jgi:hypothetical protein
MSVMSALALAQRESVQTQLAQEMKRLQGRANFRRRVLKRLESRKFSAALDASLQAEEELRPQAEEELRHLEFLKFSTALDAAVEAEESLYLKRWDDARAAIDALDSSSAPAAQLEAAHREEMQAYDAWYEFTLPSSRQRFEFILKFKLAYEDR